MAHVACARTAVLTAQCEADRNFAATTLGAAPIGRAFADNGLAALSCVHDFVLAGDHVDGCVCMWMYARVRVCVCVCLRVCDVRVCIR